MTEAFCPPIVDPWWCARAPTVAGPTFADGSPYDNECATDKGWTGWWFSRCPSRGTGAPCHDGPDVRLVTDSYCTSFPID